MALCAAETNACMGLRFPGGSAQSMPQQSGWIWKCQPGGSGCTLHCECPRKESKAKVMWFWSAPEYIASVSPWHKVWNKSCPGGHCPIDILVIWLRLVWAKGPGFTEEAGLVGCQDCALVCAFQGWGGQCRCYLLVFLTWKVFQQLPPPAVWQNSRASSFIC